MIDSSSTGQKYSPRGYSYSQSVRFMFSLMMITLLSSMTVSGQENTTKAKAVGLSVNSALQPIFAGKTPTTVGQLESMQSHVKSLADTVLRTTVGIQVGAAQGSGVLISPDGYILTAAHVSGKPNRTARVILTDGTIVRGRTLGLNRGLDAGLMKITDENWEANNWPYAEMADADSASLGQWVLALGHPGGYQSNRKPVVRLGRVIHRFDDVVTTDCTLIGGDSGGPLFGMDGKVVGIHSRIGQELIHNVHVPIVAFQTGWERMVATEDWGDIPGSPFIGVQGSAEEDNAVEGAVIGGIVKGSPADRAELKVNDIIIKFGDNDIQNFDALVIAVRIHRPGEKIKVTVQRDGEALVLTIKIGRAGGNVLPEPEEPKPSDSSTRKLPTRPTAVEYTNWVNYIAAFRPAGVHERNYREIRKAFNPVVKRAGCAVALHAGHKVVALGTIVSADGYILTKATQVITDDIKFPLDCHLPNGKVVEAELISHRPKLDLAMLKVSAKKLKAAQWNTETPVIGSWLVTPGIAETPVAFGVVSVAPRSIKGGLLGVLLGESPQGTFVERVFPNTAAQEAGMKRGDIILQVNDTEINSRDELIKVVRAHLPGEKIRLLIIRAGEEMAVEPILGRESDIAGTRAVEQQKLGGALSKRRTGFESVLQHDTVLQPEECGGPIVDLAGKTVGINIARASRVSSYALPAELFVSLIDEMKKADPVSNEQ
ncbi:MAG: PDZ domain-containing protein [Planctomycetaceae bacterium]|nr:PDZ domain-containing protein [Planctomycetaceae bacterium]MBT6847969.1 PDZ domain-containing protein [Planctomycetaceae bacterium]